MLPSCAPAATSASSDTGQSEREVPSCTQNHNRNSKLSSPLTICLQQSGLPLRALPLGSLVLRPARRLSHTPEPRVRRGDAQGRAKVQQEAVSGCKQGTRGRASAWSSSHPLWRVEFDQLNCTCFKLGKFREELCFRYLNSFIEDGRLNTTASRNLLIECKKIKGFASAASRVSALSLDCRFGSCLFLQS